MSVVGSTKLPISYVRYPVATGGKTDMARTARPVAFDPLQTFKSVSLYLCIAARCPI
jgi:hypothetical protein